MLFADLHLQMLQVQGKLFEFITGLGVSALPVAMS